MRTARFGVGVAAGFGLLALSAAGCSSGPAPEPTPEPTTGAVDLAYMFADQPALLEITDQSPSSAPPGTDFAVMVAVDRDDAVTHTQITAPPSCTNSPAVPATGRSRIVPADYATIQAAVDAADPGDTVLVQPGVYHETVHLKSDVSLVGAGAPRTILDARGDAASLIDFTGARNTVVRGFTLTGVGMASGCAQPDDPFYCSGNWYAAAIYGDGSATNVAQVDGTEPCADTSILVTQNVISANVIGMMSYFHARAVVRNNVFVKNASAFVGNHLQDHALLVQNAFVDNASLAIGSQAAYLDVMANIIAGSQVGLQYEFIQRGRVACNLFAQVGDPGVATEGDAGNLTLDDAFVDPAHGDYRPTPALIAATGNCLGLSLPDSLSSVSPEPGAFGGLLGRWTTN